MGTFILRLSDFQLNNVKRPTLIKEQNDNNILDEISGKPLFLLFK